MADCPHCSKNIESLSGFIPTADLEERLKSLKKGKDAEILELSTQLSSARTKASGFDAVVLERDGLKRDAESRTLRDARTTLLTGARVDVALLPNIEQVYDWSQNGASDDDKKSFEDWFAADAAKHVLLAPHFNGDVAPPPPPNPEDGDGINKLPAPGGGNHQPPPPPSNGKFTNADIASVFASPAYQALSVKDQQAKIKRMEAGDMT